MKKYISFVLIFLLGIGNFSITNSAGISEKSNLEMVSFIYMNDLQTTQKGKEYIVLINNLVNTNKNDLSKLQTLRDNTNKILTSTNIKDEQLKSMLGYLHARLSISLIDNGYTEKDVQVVVNGNNNSSSEANNTSSGTGASTITNNINDGKIHVKIINDKRDSQDNSETILNDLKKLPSLKDATFQIYDFSDNGVKEFLESNNIKLLPSVILNTNKIDVSKDPETLDLDGNRREKIDFYLKELPNGEFELPSNGKFNPFSPSDTTGKTYLSQTTFDKIFYGSYYLGEPKAKYTWLEYSDLQCPYCAKLHTDGTYRDLEAMTRNIIYYYHHFPLNSHPNAQTGAEIMECLGEQKGGYAFYSLLDRSFFQGKSDRQYLIGEAVRLGADQNQLEKCLSDGKYTEKVKNQLNNGKDIFGVSATPTVIIINNNTLQYEKVVGGQSINYFLDVLERLK